MSYWQLGIACPIKNNSFKFGAYKSAQLSGAYTSGLTIDVNDDLRNDFTAGEYIVVGQSTNTTTTNVGKSESAKLATVGTAHVTITSSLTYDYLSTDAISGLGRRSPSGWTVDNYTKNCTALGINHDGKNDRSAFKWSKTYLAGDLYGDVKQTITAGNILSNTVYRFGMYCKFNITGGTPTLDTTVKEDSDSSFMTGTTAKNTDVSTYTLYSRVGTTSSSLDGAGLVDVYITAGTAACSGTAWIDQVFLEHATGTDDSSAGFYTFTEYPEQNSVTWARVTPLAKVIMRNFERKIYDASGSGGKQYLYSIRCKFDNVSSTFHNNLKELENSMLEGSLLVFHHDIPNIPPVLTGVMGLSGEKWNMWDKTKVSFDFNFEEVQ